MTWIYRAGRQRVKIILPTLYNYNQALGEINQISLKDRRDELCVTDTLVKNMLQPAHKFYSLLPRKRFEIKERKTRANGKKNCNFFCKTERFKHSTLAFAIDKYSI